MKDAILTKFLGGNFRQALFQSVCLHFYSIYRGHRVHLQLFKIASFLKVLSRLHKIASFIKLHLGEKICTKNSTRYFLFTES